MMDKTQFLNELDKSFDLIIQSSKENITDEQLTLDVLEKIINTIRKSVLEIIITLMEINNE